MTSAQDYRAWPLPAPAMNINTPDCFDHKEH